MREIKFRAFDTNHKPPRMVQSSLVIWEINGDLQLRQGEIPMQYTGLKDKNGKEIYEKDIGKFWSSIGLEGVGSVEYMNGMYVVEFPNKQFDTNEEIWRPRFALVGFTVNHAFEVIGNIYENPELLRN